MKYQKCFVFYFGHLVDSVLLAFLSSCPFPCPFHLTESNISLCKWMYFDIFIRMNCIWIAISFSNSNRIWKNYLILKSEAKKTKF